LGGESDASLLTGHGFTYVGSCPGRLIEVLRESKCMNPVVLIDEVDKISETHHGKEIVGTLIHLTDTTTNKKYNYDKYFSGIEFDLSKVLFVFTYNDPDKVDKILSDRLFKIKVDNYTKREKLEIAEKHLIKNILRDYNFTDQDVKVEKEAMEYIVEHSHRNEGMRDIKRKLQIIVSRINTLMLTTGIEEIVKLKYRKLAEHFKCLPVIVRKEHVDTLLEESMTQTPSDDPPPHMYI
jgi:ATP-dependent Lon protease